MRAMSRKGTAIVYAAFRVLHGETRVKSLARLHELHVLGANRRGRTCSGLGLMSSAVL